MENKIRKLTHIQEELNDIIESISNNYFYDINLITKFDTTIYQIQELKDIINLSIRSDEEQN